MNDICNYFKRWRQPDLTDRQPGRERERPDLAIPNDCVAAQVLLQHFEHINSTMSRYKFFNSQKDNNKLSGERGRQSVELGVSLCLRFYLFRDFFAS